MMLTQGGDPGPFASVDLVLTDPVMDRGGTVLQPMGGAFRW